MTVWIDEKLCNGCRRCLRACPYDAVEILDGKASILERCTSCGACLAGCPQGAIFTDVEPRRIPDFSDYKGVWVFAEQQEGRLMPVSLELLGKARELARELGEEVWALLLGSGVKGLASTLVEHGADRVIVAEHRALATYRTLAHTKVISELVETHRPGIFLLGATPLGRDLAPRVSRRVGAGLTADCTGLSIDPEERILLQTRPAFGGNVMATIANRYSRPQMATVRPGVMEPRRSPGRKGTVLRHKVSLLEREVGVKILERVAEKPKGEALAKARVVVAGGRGVGDAAGFKALKKLASVLGGEVAGTRVAVEEGWIAQDRQVGQTGLTVRPELYVACGISGAIQHRAGMMGSRYVIAVNRDPRAPIFQVADWGIVGDLRDVIPELTKRLARARSENKGGGR